MTGKALVIGITGGLGSTLAHALAVRGWCVRALHRDPAAARARLPEPAGLRWQQGDAMKADDVTTAADGVDVIVHAANPPGYRNWHGLAIPMLDHAIAAARATGATLLFPGNVYNYGTDAWPIVSEASPQNPPTRKGRIRVDMERMLEAAAADGVQCIVLRAGDFFGGSTGGAWFSSVLVRPGRPVKSVTYPGRRDAGHAWAYLPDLAEAFARIAERRAELGAFETFHFGGHYLEPGVEMARAILRTAGAPEGRIRGLPWWLLKAVAPFNETYRELLEMRYLWDISLSLDNSRLVSLLGAEPHTPLDTAVRDTLVALGCLRAA